MAKIDWCKKAERVCGFGISLRNMAMVGCPVACENFTTLTGSCETCVERHLMTAQEAESCGFSRKFYKAHKEDMYWCKNELVGADGCMYYKPKES